MQRVLHDHYFKEAKREGYLSRAAYKLIEIDAKKSILRAGQQVLDAGAAPGSWTQVAAAKVGEQGRVVAIDLSPLAPQARRSNVTALEADFNDVTAEMLEAAGVAVAFDVILSDMAPKTTGDRTIDHHGSINLARAVLDRASAWLRPGGAIVIKVFEGEAYAEFLADARSRFERVKGYKPAASRAISREMYVIGQGFKPPLETTVETPEQRPRPTGW